VHLHKVISDALPDSIVMVDITKVTSLIKSIEHALLTGSLSLEKAEALLAAATTASSATIINFEGMAVAPPEAPRTFTSASNVVSYHAPAVLEVVTPGPNASTSKKDTNGDTYVQPTNKKDDACSNNIHVPSDLIHEIMISYATKGNRLHGAICYKCNIKFVSKSPAGPTKYKPGETSRRENKRD